MQAHALNHIVRDVKPDIEVEHIAYLHPCHQAVHFKKSRPSLFFKRQLFSR